VCVCVNRTVAKDVLVVWSGCAAQVWGNVVREKTKRPLRGRVTEALLSDDAVATDTDSDGMERSA